MGEKEGSWGERVKRTNGSQCGIRRPGGGLPYETDRDARRKF